MLEHEGKRTIEAGERAEAALEILVGAETDDLPVERHYEADETNENDGYHHSLHEQNPVAGVGVSGVGEERDAAGDGGKH